MTGKKPFARSDVTTKRRAVSLLFSSTEKTISLSVFRIARAQRRNLCGGFLKRARLPNGKTRFFIHGRSNLSSERRKVQCRGLDRTLSLSPLPSLFRLSLFLFFLLPPLSFSLSPSNVHISLFITSVNSSEVDGATIVQFSVSRRRSSRRPL